MSVLAAKKGADSAMGAMKTITNALIMPMISFRLQPGRWRGRKDARKYVPDPRYPEGIMFCFPAWLVAFVGIPIMAITIGYIANYLGYGKEDKKSRGLISETWGLVAKAGSPLALGFEALTGKDIFAELGL